jgi:hypothetical protein
MNEATASLSGFQVQPYHGANWFTTRGVRIKRRLIEKKGLPVFKRCLFITLTIPEGVCSPVEAYEKGSDRIRRFLAKFRKAVGQKFPWAWKLEFQENGYPHWHLVIDYKKRIPRELLPLVGDWWGLGRVNVRRLRQKDFQYLFKYVSKAAAGDGDPETGIGLPSWVLDYRKRLADGRLSAGIRFWQTGGGFYQVVKAPNEPTEEEPEQSYSRMPYTIRQRWGVWMRKATLFRRDAAGRIVQSFQVYFVRPYWAVTMEVIKALGNGKAAVVSGANGWTCCFKKIGKEISQCQKQNILKILLWHSGTTMVYFSAD